MGGQDGSIEWKSGDPSIFDPDISPQEKWGVFSHHPVYYKLIGNLSSDIAMALAWKATAEYVILKHGLSLSKLQHINTSALQWYLIDSYTEEGKLC
jgi:hypothetical protein